MRRTTTVRPSFSPTAKASRWSIWSRLFWTKRFSSSIGSSRSTHSSAPSAAPPAVSVEGGPHLALQPALVPVGRAVRAGRTPSPRTRRGTAPRRGASTAAAATTSSSLPAGGLRWSASGCVQPTSTQTRGRVRGRRGGRLAVAVDGAEQRVVRRPDDAQQAAAVAGVGLAFQPAEPLAVVAETQDLDDQPAEVVLAGRLEQDRRLFQAVERIGVAPERQDLRPAADGDGDGGAAGLAQLDAEAAQVVLSGCAAAATAVSTQTWFWSSKPATAAAWLDRRRHGAGGQRERSVSRSGNFRIMALAVVAANTDHRSHFGFGVPGIRRAVGSPGGLSRVRNANRSAISCGCELLLDPPRASATPGCLDIARPGRAGSSPACRPGVFRTTRCVLSSTSRPVSDAAVRRGRPSSPGSRRRSPGSGRRRSTAAGRSRSGRSTVMSGPTSLPSP